MIELNVQQGSPEWLAARAKCFNASEAPAMMGVSPYLTRSELLREKATGITRDHDAAALARFAAGHEAEAKARPLVEQNVIGEELFPVVATDDAGRLLASSDGATMLYDVGFEHKLWNEEIAAQIRAGKVPEYHKWQLDQQIAIFGFEKIIFVCSDGTPEKFVWCEYRTTPERIARLMAGWAQFEQDMAAYVPEAPAAAPPAGRAPDDLPALRIEVTGMVTASNLNAFREHAMAVFGGIKTDLQTDADFADAEKTVKWCKDVEDRLDGAKQHALSQTASIDKLFSTIDAIKEEARSVRLKLDRLVKSEKETRKLQIVADAHCALVDHIKALHQRLGGQYLPASLADQRMFGEAIKGLKSLDSMRDKVSAALANAKIEANATADRIDANRKTVEDMSLFPDFAQVCTKAPDDFAALLSMRLAQRRDAEERRLEAERQRIRAEEQAKAQREAQEAERQRLRQEAEARQAAMQAEAAKREAELIAQRAQEVKPEPVVAAASQLDLSPEPPADTGRTITLGQINTRLAPIALSKDGIAQLGIEPVGRERSAVLYRESDIDRICVALIRHLSAVSNSVARETRAAA